jgi:hypothetical protein
MVSSSASEKRRFSDHTNKNNSAVSDALDMEVPAKRRQTIGDMPQQPALKATPSKHRVSLGPVGSYYISGLPKTPRSKKKRPKNDNEELKGYEAVRTEALSICAPPPHSEQLCSNEKESTNEMTGEFSFATSSDSEDAMNKSVLSDPTELTASSFVFASASRQRLQVSSNEVLDGKENTISHVEEKIQVAVDEKKLKDPIPLQSRLSTSPASLRKLTESLKQSRLRSDEERVKRLSYSSSQDTPSVERVFIEVAASEHENHVMNESVESDVSSVKLDVSESSIANLFDGLLDPAPNRQHQSPASETSLLVSPPRKQSFLTNPVSPQTTTSRLQSPGMSPIATDITEEGAIRLTPTKSKLTPTKLKQSPRRVPNHSAVDSPARNTRSASKKAQEAIESEATKKRGSEDKQPSEEQSKRVKETHPEQSHAAPKGILNSAKKKPQAQDSSSRKSVAFGSPEAAEYHVDDPSGTLTPMPAFRAKAMFSIPKESKSEESTSSSEASINQLDAEDTTVDIEVNLNDLIRNTEVLQDYVEGIEDLPGDSTGPNHDDTFETQESTAELEASMNGLIQEVVGKIHQAELPKEEQTTTVELEADMSSLLKAADQETAIGNENSPATSVDMADTESIASVNAPGNDSRNESYEGQELFAGADFQETTEEPSPEEDDTVELETDMSAILAMASQGHDSDGSPPAIKLTDKFPKIKSTLVPATNRMSFGNGGSSRRDIRDFSPATFDFGLSDTPVSTSSLRRRSDGSRRRFSLAKSCRLSMSSDASFLLDATVESVMQAAGNSDAREGQAEQVVTREPFTLTNKEINAMADGLHDKIIDNGFPLAISSLWGPGNVVDSFVSESIQNFAVAVCAEVEEKIMVIPDSVACFEDMLEQIQGARKDLQAWLRNDRNEADIKTIAAVSRTMAENEWSTWEKMVVDSMVSTIDQTLGDLDPESNQLDKYSTFVDDMIECLSFKAGRAAQRARHRTMLRHKVWGYSIFHLLCSRSSLTSFILLCSEYFKQFDGFNQRLGKPGRQNSGENRWSRGLPSQHRSCSISNERKNVIPEIDSASAKFSRVRPTKIRFCERSYRSFSTLCTRKGSRSLVHRVQPSLYVERPICFLGWWYDFLLLFKWRFPRSCGP